LTEGSLADNIKYNFEFLMLDFELKD
jgi:hypothetical protein